MTQRFHKIVHVAVRADVDVSTALRELEAVAEAPAVAALAELRVVGSAEAGLAISMAAESLEIVAAAWACLLPWANTLGAAADRVTAQGPCLFAAGGDATWRDFARLGPERGLASFAEAVRASGMVWGLYGDTWARSDAVPGLEALPFWPNADLALACVTGPWEDCVPRPIKLDTLVEQWLASMEEDRIAVVLVPTPTHSGVVVAAPELAAALAR